MTMTLHFAYGSNMSRPAMCARCPGAVALGVATLADWRFVITRDGYASIIRQADSVVHGVLWQLQAPDLAELNRYEDIKSGLYRCSELTVRHDAAERRAMVYIGRDRPEGNPRHGYMESVLDAARDWELPTEYIHVLRQWTLPQRHKKPASEMVK